MNLIKGPIIPFLKDKVKRHEYLLTCEIKFDAAHRLSNYKGKCSRIHGHTYRVIITVKSFKTAILLHRRNAIYRPMAQ